MSSSVLYRVTVAIAFCSVTASCCCGSNAETEDASELAQRASAAIKHGDLETGARYLGLAIKANPDDVGKACEPRRELTEIERWWGELQLELMLKDRPAMNRHVTKGDALWEWACYQFTGAGGHEKARWRPVQPRIANAMTLWQGDGHKPLILVSQVRTRGPHQGKRQTFEELWRCAVFELRNARRQDSFIRRNDQARRGELSRREYTKSHYRLEMRSLQETRAFYFQRFLPWAAEHNVSTNPISLVSSIPTRSRRATYPPRLAMRPRFSSALENTPCRDFLIC